MSHRPDAAATKWGTIPINVDGDPPDAPTGVTGGSGESLIRVSWKTTERDLQEFIVYIDNAPTTGGAAPCPRYRRRRHQHRRRRRQQQQPGRHVRLELADLGRLASGPAEQHPRNARSKRRPPPASTSCPTTSAATARRSPSSTVDKAGNRSPLSNLACVAVVPTESFWDRYKANGGQAEGGCACRTSGKRSVDERLADRAGAARAAPPLAQEGVMNAVALSVAVAAAAALVSSLLFLAAAPARAQVELDVEPVRDYSSPEYFAVEFRIGPYQPEMDGNDAFETFFGDDDGPLLALELDYILYRVPNVIYLGAGGGIGWMNFDGNTRDDQGAEHERRDLDRDRAAQPAGRGAHRRPAAHARGADPAHRQDRLPVGALVDRQRRHERRGRLQRGPALGASSSAWISTRSSRPRRATWTRSGASTTRSCSSSCSASSPRAIRCRSATTWPGPLASDSCSDRPVKHGVRLTVAYDGTGFVGWAAQPGMRTVQGVHRGGRRANLPPPGRGSRRVPHRFGRARRGPGRGVRDPARAHARALGHRAEPLPARRPGRARRGALRARLRPALRRARQDLPLPVSPRRGARPAAARARLAPGEAAAPRAAQRGRRRAARPRRDAQRVRRVDRHARLSRLSRRVRPTQEHRAHAAAPDATAPNTRPTLPCSRSRFTA